MTSFSRTVLVTGGAGYIGSVLVRRLLERGHGVRVLDAFLFGDAGVRGLQHPQLDVRRGDIRDGAAVTDALEGCDAVVHLAAMANDPCAELDEELTREINLTAVEALAETASAAGVRRFVNASSATVYGVQDGTVLDESASLEPITIYGVLKAQTEELLKAMASAEFEPVSLRAATVCGISPRLRLDLTVNILTLSALTKGVISVHGGAQVRPNVHIGDLVRAYVAVLEAPAELVAGRSFNVGFENLPVGEIAERVASSLPERPEIETVPIVDHRSYRIKSELIGEALGFAPEGSIDDAVRELASAHAAGRIASPEETTYSNIRHLREVGFR
jgi:nucleoside-diphosphate-sugar epimerase